MMGLEMHLCCSGDVFQLAIPVVLCLVKLPSIRFSGLKLYLLPLKRVKNSYAVI